MNTTYISLSSLSMDLKRVAVGFHRGSILMANRFMEEAFKRRDEIDINSVKPYVRTLLLNLDSLNDSTDSQAKAENALMYSTLFQNASLQNIQ